VSGRLLLLIGILIGTSASLLINLAASMSVNFSSSGSPQKGETNVHLTVPKNLSDTNRIRSLTDIKNLRKETVTSIFGQPELPNRQPDYISVVPNSKFKKHADVKTVQRLYIEMDDITSIAYLLYPKIPKSDPSLIVYHTGHGQRFLYDSSTKSIIDAFISGGHHILLLDMPKIKHELFETMERPLRYFLEPVAVALNYATNIQNFDDVIMVGLSGGGWTTVVYSALDLRIKLSIPVAGTYPFYLREILSNSQGDYEQSLPGIDVNYLELYVMSAHEGRMQAQIFHSKDNCCFSGMGSNTYNSYISNIAAEMGGKFSTLILDQRRHEILDQGILSIDKFLNKLKVQH